MPIVVSCSACQMRLTLGDDRAGDRFECPQCDAMIKVPGPSQPPPRAQAAAPAAAVTEPAPMDFDSEPEPAPGMDKRVLGGIIAGGAALLIVLAAVVFAVRKSPDVVKQDPEPSTPATTPANAPKPAPTADTGTGGTPPETSTPVVPPKTGMGPAPLPQFQAQFLGSQGQGRRFCIIADNSDSMRGTKLEGLKTQLLKTLTDLNPDSEFYVICFNANPEPMPHPTWLKAGAPETEKVRTWVRSLKTVLGTKPVPAFEAAFKLDPPPDVIFFMTDGQFADTAPARVVTLNGTPPKSVVNTILFAAGAPKVAAKATAAEGLLKRIADQNGGTFTRYAP